MKLRVSDSSSAHHQGFVTVQTPDDGERNCPKHVEFHSKNKFEKLVHLVGFIIRNLSRCTVTWTSIRLFHFSAHKYLATYVDSNCYFSLSLSLFFIYKIWKSLQVLIKFSGVKFLGHNSLSVTELLQGHESCTLGACERSWKRQKFRTLNLFWIIDFMFFHAVLTFSNLRF